MVANYFLFAWLLLTACLLQDSSAAITPVDETYNATVGENFTIQWTFDNEPDLDQVLWRYKSSTAATTTIMSKLGAASAQVIDNFNVVHVGNGDIELNSVTLDNAGIYFCQVSYTLVSGYPTVTGTATLFVTNTPTTASIATTTSTKPTTTSTIPSSTTTTSTTGTPSVTSTNPTTKSTMLTTTSTTSSTKGTKSTTGYSAITVTDNGHDGKLAVIIVSSVVGGLLLVGIAIAALFIFHRQRKKKTTSKKQSHKGSDHHKQFKASKSPYQQRNDYYMYNCKTLRSQVQENPLNRVSKDRNLSRSYHNGAPSWYDNYRPSYTMERFHNSGTSGYRVTSSHISDNRNPRNPKYSSYPGYPMGNMRYTDSKIFHLY